MRGIPTSYMDDCIELDCSLICSPGTELRPVACCCDVCRTFDPEQADFFYVPAYVTCWIFPVFDGADFPWYFGPVREWHKSIMPV